LDGRRPTPAGAGLTASRGAVIEAMMSRHWERIDERFEVQLDKPIAQGGFAAVFRGRDRYKTELGEFGDVAAKRMPLNDHDLRDAFMTEMKCLREVHDSERIVSLIGTASINDDQEGWLFMEMATGGELFDRLLDTHYMSERVAWPYVRALFEAVQHCHRKGIAHRDIKLENVMLCAEDPHAIKLIDFGLACTVRRSKDGKVIRADLRHDIAGTQAYRAPEVVLGEYDPLAVDVWACGIMLIALCAGFFPFREAKLDDDWRFRRFADLQPTHGACLAICMMYRRECPFTSCFVEAANRMLEVEPSKRATIEQVMELAWLQAPVGRPLRAPEANAMTYRGIIADACDEDPKPFLLPPPDSIPIKRHLCARHAR